MKKPILNQYQRLIIRENPESTGAQLFLTGLEIKKLSREIRKEIDPHLPMLIKIRPFAWASLLLLIIIATVFDL